jgi:membrane protease YdiL (CAAX protease family)
VAYNRWSAGSVLIGLAVTAAMVAVARGFGLHASDLGLVKSTMMVGLRWGGAALAVAGCLYAVALMIPAIRDAVGGSAGSWPQALVAAFVVIPLGTVIPEEVAFRGVLWALLRRSADRWVATAVSSAVFGIWHVLPALAGGSANQAVDAVVGGGTLGLLVRVAGTVLFTTSAGVLFCELRIRSGSLLAPMLAHWAVNGLGVIFVQLA